MLSIIDYSYDALSRLISGDVNGSNVYNYGYDVSGNLIEKDGTTRVFNEYGQCESYVAVSNAVGRVDINQIAPDVTKRLTTRMIAMGISSHPCGRG